MQIMLTINTGWDTFVPTTNVTCDLEKELVIYQSLKFNWVSSCILYSETKCGN